MGLPETSRADLLVLLEPVGKVRLGMKAEFGGDRLDREVRFAQASPGVRDAPVVEIPGRRVMKECVKKPVEMGEGDFPHQLVESFLWLKATSQDVRKVIENILASRLLFGGQVAHLGIRIGGDLILLGKDSRDNGG